MYELKEGDFYLTTKDGLPKIVKVEAVYKDDLNNRYIKFFGDINLYRVSSV
jgi:hypothetical protein